MLQMLSDFLPKEYPEHFKKQGNTLTALKTNEIFEIEGGSMDPLEACARIVQVLFPGFDNFTVVHCLRQAPTQHLHFVIVVLTSQASEYCTVYTLTKTADYKCQQLLLSCNRSWHMLMNIIRDLKYTGADVHRAPT